jgi:hypothetical protein
MPDMQVRERVRRGERTEDEPEARGESQHSRDAHGLVHGAELIMEIEGAWLPQERCDRLAHDRADTRALRRGEPDGEAAKQEARPGQERHALQRGPQRRRVVANAKRSLSEPEHAGDREAADRLLEIEALEHVEHAKADEEHDRQAQRSFALAPEIRGSRE